jgi:hypothetical protein
MDLLKFLALVVPFGTVCFVIGHIMGWWRGYRKAIEESYPKPVSGMPRHL